MKTVIKVGDMVRIKKYPGYFASNNGQYPREAVYPVIATVEKVTLAKSKQHRGHVGFSVEGYGFALPFNRKPFDTDHSDWIEVIDKEDELTSF